MSAIVDGSNGVQVPVVTTAQKNALTVTAGYIVFDSTLGKICVYTSGGWQTVTSA